MHSDEWVGGIVGLPSYVSGEGEPYRPSALLLVEPDSGVIVGTELARPDDVLARAPQMFMDAASAPLVGAPRAPARLRVAAPELYAALRDRVGDVDVVLAPTPELDPVAESLRAAMTVADSGDGGTNIGPDMTPDDLAHMFRAAARLYRLQPWQTFPPDGFASIICEALGIVDGALCVVGQQGESYGLTLFRTPADAVAFVEETTALERDPGRKPSLPAHILISYDGDELVGPQAMREAREHGWELAGPRAFPTAVFVDTDLAARGLTRAELAGATAVMEAIADFIEAEPGLASAWDDYEPLDWRSEVATAVGTVEVQLAAPLWLPEGEELARAQVLDRFADSPEASPELIGWAEMLIDYASSYCGDELWALTPAELDELLFEVFPRKVSVEPEEAGSIVGAARAFLAFAARELGSRQARVCLDRLAPDAERRLARELADPQNFGMAKSIFMAGKSAGHDMTSQDGLNAWMNVVNSRFALGRWPDPAPAPAPAAGSSPARSRAAATKARAKRKAARKARKKSRRR